MKLYCPGVAHRQKQLRGVRIPQHGPPHRRAHCRDSGGPTGSAGWATVPETRTSQKHLRHGLFSALQHRCEERKIEVSMLQTGIVQRRDVSILYFVILYRFTQYI